MNYGVVVLCGLFFASIGGAQSVSLVSSCATVRCSKGTACVETVKGPKCVSTAPKPGLCPMFKCPLPTLPTLCKPPICTYDSQCPGTQKCCKGCHGCGFCFQPPDLPSCRYVRCSKGTACVETVKGPKCVSTAPKPGLCPMFKCPLPTLPTLCKPPICTYDSQCPGTQKCCKGCHGCGFCFQPPDLPSCRYVKCSPGYECILVPVKCYRNRCPYKPLCLNAKCLQPAEPGLCEAYIPSWFFDVSTGRCQQFIYGGCGGNSNRFNIEEECKKVCLGSIPK